MEEEQSIDIGRYVGILLHWWWIVALGVLVFAGVAYGYSTIVKDTVYRARATILIQESRSGLAPGIGDIQASSDLARTYRQLLTTRPLLQRVIDELALLDEPDGLGNRVSISVRSGTPLIDIEVEHSDPNLPVAIANTLTQVFIQERQTTRLGEIARLEALAAAQGTTDTTALREAQLSTLASMSIVEEATVATAFVTPSTRKNMLLGGFLGLFLGVVLAFFLDYSSYKIRSVEQIDNLVTRSNLPPSIIGVVFQWRPNEVAAGELVVHTKPESIYSEMFRQVRTGFQFAANSGPGNAFMITSVGPQEGKSTIISNLGVALSQGGHKVIVVDSDLRRPTVHRLFNLDRRHGGLSTIIADDQPATSQLRDTDVDGLRILLSGPIPTNPADLLGSSKMDQVLDDLKSECDYLLLDSPPIMSASDAPMLASKVDGILLVVNMGETRSDTFQDALRQIQRANTPVLGYVVNKVKAQKLGYGERYRYRYRYHYYYRRQEDEEDEISSVNGQEPKPRHRSEPSSRATRLGRRVKHLLHLNSGHDK